MVVEGEGGEVPETALGHNALRIRRAGSVCCLKNDVCVWRAK